MKTPREILLQRHKPSADKLDAMRQSALREAFAVSQRAESDESWATRVCITFWRELIWPARGIWASLAAIWVGLMLVNLVADSGVSRGQMMASAKPTEVMMTFREEKQLMVELTGPLEFKDAEPPKKSVPQPRSELQLNIFVI